MPGRTLRPRKGIVWFAAVSGSHSHGRTMGLAPRRAIVHRRCLGRGPYGWIPRGCGCGREQGRTWRRFYSGSGFTLAGVARRLRRLSRGPGFLLLGSDTVDSATRWWHPLSDPPATLGIRGMPLLMTFVPRPCSPQSVQGVLHVGLAWAWLYIEPSHARALSQQHNLARGDRPVTQSIATSETAALLAVPPIIGFSPWFKPQGHPGCLGGSRRSDP